MLRLRFTPLALLVLACSCFGGCRGESPPGTSTDNAGTDQVDGQSEGDRVIDSGGPFPHRLNSIDGSYIVEYRVLPGAVPLNQPFTIEARVLRDANGSPVADEAASIVVDARMPHHRHGMLTTPVLTARGGGLFRVEGMQFHMPGRWELYFDITENGVTERAMDVIVLE